MLPLSSTPLPQIPSPFTFNGPRTHIFAPTTALVLFFEYPSDAWSQIRNPTKDIFTLQVFTFDRTCNLNIDLRVMRCRYREQLNIQMAYPIGPDEDTVPMQVCVLSPLGLFVINSMGAFSSPSPANFHQGRPDNALVLKNFPPSITSNLRATYREANWG